MVRVDTEPEGNGHDQRHHDDNRREDVHQHADADEEEVQGDQEHDLGGDEPFHRLEDHHRDARLNEERRETDGGGQNRENRTDERHRLADDPREVGAEADVPVDPDLDDEGVDGGERRRLMNAEQSAVHPAEQRDGKQRLPLGLPEGPHGDAPIEARPGHLLLDAGDRAVDRQRSNRNDAGDQASQEQLLDHDAGDDAVDDHRHARREQKPKRAARGDQAKGEILLVLVRNEGRIEKTANGHDRDAAAAGEGREEGRGDEADHRQAAGHPT